MIDLNALGRTKITVKCSGMFGRFQNLGELSGCRWKGKRVAALDRQPTRYDPYVGTRYATTCPCPRCGADVKIDSVPIR